MGLKLFCIIFLIFLTNFIYHNHSIDSLFCILEIQKDNQNAIVLINDDQADRKKIRLNTDQRIQISKSHENCTAMTMIALKMKNDNEYTVLNIKSVSIIPMICYSVMKKRC